ncbi:MAG: GNAT family N-acetyltransferase [Chloroflexi bacterium]|nr:GNAT family N-acetyltransferase [Chloroflexota bacterium]
MASAIRAGTALRPGIEVRPTRDRELLREFLETDRLMAAYALCDLDDREFGRTRWGVALDRGEPVAVALEYLGMSPQPLFVMGEPGGVTAVLRDVLRPRTAYLASRTELLDSVAAVYRVQEGPPMVRMWVDRASFRPAPSSAVRLVAADIGELNKLYEFGLTSWLPSDAVANGVYYGVRLEGRLVAAAGTHVIGRQLGLAAVGNVLTHRDFRGRGYAKAVTGAVTQELLRFCDQVVLNVRADNPPALGAYRALGYQEHTRFEERLVHRKGSVWDSILGPFKRWVPTSWRGPTSKEE